MMIDRWLAIRVGLSVVFGLVLFSSVDGVMRESDQASLLDGAIQIARDGKVVRDGFYNYSVQFGSYWVLAVCFVVSGSQRIACSPEQVILVGNFVSCAVFFGGVALLLVRRGPRTPLEFVVTLAFLLSPMVLLNGALLSTNLLSAGCLCVLVFFLSGRVSWLRDLVVGLFGFFAVAMRGDAVLVLPLLALLSLDEKNWRGMLAVRRLWILASVSILALVLGRLLSGRGHDSYPVYFEPKIAITYFVFGLGSLSLLFPLLVSWLAVGGLVRKRGLMLLISISMLLPLLFYSRILVTPRHLMTTALVPFFFICFAQSRSWVDQLIGLGWQRLAMMLLVSASVVPLVYGVRLSSLKSGSLVSTNPTLYPTADGYWPMGCYGQFLAWLRVAARVPIDHNQRVWQAWAALEEIPSIPEGVGLNSNGLASLGLLRSTQLGQRNRLSAKNHDEFLMTTRSFSKNKVNYYLGRERNEKPLKNKGVCLSSGSWDEVIFQTVDGEVLEGRGFFGPLLSRYGNGDDFVLGNKSAPWVFLRGGGSFRWLFFSKNDGDELWVVRETILGREGWKTASEEELWMARSALPSFFTVENYGR